MKPGEYFIDEGSIELNPGRDTQSIIVTNTGDRPIQVGSHYHFFETNASLNFERALTKGFRLNVPSGTAIRFEPGQEREVELVRYSGLERVFGFRGEVMGELSS